MKNLKERKNNLVNPNQFRSKEALLKPFPTKHLKKVIKDFFKTYKIAPEDQIPFSKMWNLFKGLYKFSKENLYFNDWRYIISSFYNIYEEKIITKIIAEKVNTKVKLLLNQEFFSEYEIINKDPFTKDFATEFTAKFFIKQLYNFIDKTKKNIHQWNEICRHTSPLITARPPVKKMVNDLSVDFMNNVAKVEFENCEYDSFDKFMIEQPLWAGFTIFGSFINNLWEFGKNNSFKLFFEEITVDGELMILDGYIKIKNVPIKFIVYENAYNLYREHFYGDEMYDRFTDISEVIMEGVIQWNKIIEGDL